MTTDLDVRTEAFKSEIQKAIGAHGVWKMRLKSAIQQGRTDLNVSTVSRDDQCEFGKWLYGLADLRLKQLPHYAEVKNLHASFHHKTSEIVRALNEGRIGDAGRLMAPGGEWDSVGAALTSKMTEWRKRLE